MFKITQGGQTWCHAGFKANSWCGVHHSSTGADITQNKVWSEMSTQLCAAWRQRLFCDASNIVFKVEIGTKNLGCWEGLLTAAKMYYAQVSMFHLLLSRLSERNDTSEIIDWGTHFTWYTPFFLCGSPCYCRRWSGVKSRQPYLKGQVDHCSC